MSHIPDVDLYLFAEGTAQRAYRFLGAHPKEEDPSCVRFAVWAPSAEAVSVIGDFNGWQAGSNPLQPTASSGVWQGEVRGLAPGSAYKYAIVPAGGSRVIEKADPYGFWSETRPATASRVWVDDGYQWQDAEWLQRRSMARASAAPISIYEAHLGSWRRDPNRTREFLTYRDLAGSLPGYVRSLGYTHIQLLPIAEHPLDMSWGYQTVGYYAPTSRFGTPSDFKYFVDHCHAAGLGVLLDWVPAHFPKDAHGLGRFDGSHLYEHADPRQGEHPDWGTLIFNYGRNEVRSFLVSNAIFWLDEYHIDGLRVDAVASMLYLDYSRDPGQWIPNRHGGRENLEAIVFLRQVNDAVHTKCPGALMIAEESTAWPGVTTETTHGGLGFDFKWNMGWMHDTLAYLEHDPIHRAYHHDEITFSLVYAFSERFVLPLSHDEVVHGKRSLLAKMPGDVWQQFANLRLLFGYMWTHPGKKLLFMGSEFGQWNEWTEAQSLDWHLLESDGEESARHAGLQRLVGDLNGLMRQRPAMYELDSRPEGFEWIDHGDASNSVLAYLRRSESGGTLLVVCNFTPVVRYDYRIGLPGGGPFREILNTDSNEYGGSGVGAGRVDVEAIPWHGRQHSASITLPPLAAVILAES